MAIKATRWLNQFQRFIADIRISSKEILTSDPRGAPLVLWESQKRFLREVGDGLDQGIHYFNCLKGRQQGITTVSLAIDLFWLCVHPNLIMCLVTDDEKKREANRTLLVSYFNSFEPGYFGDLSITTNNRTVIKFSNGSRLDLLVAGTKQKNIGWAEGVGYYAAHLTEVSNYGNVEGLKSLEEGFSQGHPHRLFIYESTAKGFNHWRNKWINGLSDISQRSWFSGWWACDPNQIERRDPRFVEHGALPPLPEERELIEQVRSEFGWRVSQEQLAWVRWKAKQAGNEIDLLEQNQPWTPNQAFVMTGYSFFQNKMIAGDIQRIYDDPSIMFKGYTYEVDGDFYNFHLVALDPETDSVDRVELRVWSEPVEGAKYAIGFDPAYGRNDHRDGNAIQVFRCFADRVEQVAEYRSADVEVKHASWVCFHLAAAYRDCVVNVELTGVGRMVMEEFKHLRQLLSAEMNQARTEAKKWTDAAANARWFLYNRIDSFSGGYAANTEMTHRIKMEIYHTMRGCYISKEITIKSIALLREMSNIIVNDGDIGAPESQDDEKKDDRCAAMGLAILSWQKWIRPDMINLGQTYEAVMREESGEASPPEIAINSMVARFLARADEEVEPAPSWLARWGLEGGRDM